MSGGRRFSSGSASSVIYKCQLIGYYIFFDIFCNMNFFQDCMYLVSAMTLASMKQTEGRTHMAKRVRFSRGRGQMSKRQSRCRTTCGTVGQLDVVCWNRFLDTGYRDTGWHAALSR
jgi:hypothetical protein